MRRLLHGTPLQHLLHSLAQGQPLSQHLRMYLVTLFIEPERQPVQK